MRQHSKSRKAFLKKHLDFRVDVPEGTRGIYEIRRHVMSPEMAKYLNDKAMWEDKPQEEYAGTYTQLLRMNRDYINAVVMSDHPCEVADHEPLITYAQKNAPLKHVLINGLGIGVVIELLMPYVEKITNVEISREVIHLTGPHYQQHYGSRLKVVHCDAFKYTPPKGVYYDAVFHDIWDDITYANLPEMAALHQKYEGLCDWQDSWAKDQCEADELERGEWAS